jgi:hypothetical protein
MVRILKIGFLNLQRYHLRYLHVMNKALQGLWKDAVENPNISDAEVYIVILGYLDIVYSLSERIQFTDSVQFEGHSNTSRRDS